MSASRHAFATCSAAALCLALVSGGPVFAQAAQQPPLNKVASFEHEATGIAVSHGGRIFVTFPRWTEDAPISVAEVKDGKPVPYPDAEWNRWRNTLKDKVDARDHFVCVQTAEFDHAGHLWALDAGAPALSHLVPGAPKLVEIDLATNKVIRVVPFDDSVAPEGSYINDIRFSPDDKTAYLTDSGAKGAIVVLDVSSGKARRVLDGYPETQADPKVTITYDGKPLRRPDGRGVDFTADGIAISPDGRTLYWQALKGKTLYSLPTKELEGGVTTSLTPESLGNRLLSNKITTVGTNGPADGLLISKADGRMYITGPEDNAVKVRDLRAQDASPTVLIKDDRLRWPDTFAEGADGTIFFTTSHIMDNAYYRPDAPPAQPTELWSFKPAAAK